MPLRQSAAGDGQTIAALPSAPLPGSAIILQTGTTNGATLISNGWSDLLGGAYPRFVGGGQGFGLYARFAAPGDDGNYPIPVSDYIVA